MNQRVSFPSRLFELIRATKAVGLFAVFALLLLSIPHAAAQCSPVKRFTSRPSGKTPPALYIQRPADGTAMEIGKLWQSDSSSINNFGGGCPPSSWLHESMVPGRVYIEGAIGGIDCIWNGCPQYSITLTLEDQRVDGQDAYLVALQTDENMFGIFDFTCLPPPPVNSVLPFLPFPGIDVVAAHVAPPNIILSLNLDDVGANVHACTNPFPPPASSIVESYDLLVHYGPADPGRLRSSWIRVSNVPYVEGGILPVELVVACPPIGADAFLALGLNFQGGVDGPVSSDLVGASIVVIDADGDGINDCHDSCIDRDGDGYGNPGGGGGCLGLDCDDDAGNVYPGAPQVCDGINNDCDHASWPALNHTNEYDDDGDGLSECQGDCDDTAGAIYPGAAQVCDGVNNDCGHAGWPALNETNEYDDDGDGLSECAGDCDDTDRNNWASCATCSDADEDGYYTDCDAYVTIDGPDNCPNDYNPAQTDDDLDDFGQPCDCDDADPRTHPGAVEVNDGLDNQCPGDEGHGQIDETSGDSGFHDPDDTTAYSWPPQEDATRYEVARATEADFTEDCVLIHTPEHQVETSWTDEQEPAPGEIFFYANRPIESHVGSWGADVTGEQRHVSCISYVWGFVDTNDDDVGSASLYDFFDASFAGPSDYIRVWVLNMSWCAERADFYRESYLQLAIAGGTVNSGNWAKWRWAGVEGWAGPDLDSHPNQFGSACWNSRPYCWGSESGLFETLILYLNPDDPTFCEAEFVELGCFSTPTVAEVRIAGTFDDACNAPRPTLPEAPGSP